ncbi:MAG TPA: glycoside hydrolase [Candidatus Acidoferrales bacterium]|nr:glycoside hydrolase [Candidatus Acidoferrales bacterium]
MRSISAILFAFFCFAALLLQAQPLFAGGAATAATTVAKINPANILVDNFQGWGVSLCWWANVVGGYTNRDDYADLIFNRLKLNIVRYNIGGGENPDGPGTIQFRARVPGFEPKRGVWNWDADRNQRWMLKAALKRGVNRVEVFANSPPYWMTASGSVTGAKGGTNNLKVACEQDFAVYLAEVIKHLSRVDGVTFDSITPVNEPSSRWWVFGGHQEGCHMDAVQQERVINLLRAELDRRGLHLLIDAPEENDEQSGINSLKTYTANCLNNIGQISTHSYKANNPEGLSSLAAALHKPLRQSEYGDGDPTGMKLARRIRDDLTQLRPISWCYWQGADYAGWGLLYNRLAKKGRQKYVITKKFCVFEQFTRFLRPGCQIIDCGDTDSVAGYDPSSKTLSIVTVNNSSNDFDETFDLSNFATTGNIVECYRTSDGERFQQLKPVPVDERRFGLAFPADSVTTCVLQNVYSATTR